MSEIFSATVNSLAVVAANPAVVLALLGVLVLILFSVRVKKIGWTVSMTTNIAVMLAVAVVLNQLRLFHMPQGGSVTPGSMMPLFLIAWRYGVNVGMLAGFLFGIINILQDPFILHPVQVLFDYPLPFMAMGLAALVADNFFLGVIIAFAGRFLCHFLSGIVFFGAYAPEGVSPVMWSLSFNATYIVGETLVCLALVKVLPIKRMLTAMDKSLSPSH